MYKSISKVMSDQSNDIEPVAVNAESAREEVLYFCHFRAEKRFNSRHHNCIFETQIPRPVPESLIQMTIEDINFNAN